MMHLCSRCRQSKSEDSFHKNAGSKRGVCSYCKSCEKEYRREYLSRPAVRRHRAEIQKAYAAKNRKKLLKYWRDYNQRPDIRERNRAFRGVYYRGHKEEQRAKLFLKKYGIQIEAYDAMFDRQAGLCAICGNPPKSNRRLALDHCHVTGTVRGLLCDACNQALGLLRDDPKIIAAAGEYLGKFANSESAKTAAA